MVLLFFAFQRSDEKWKGVANAHYYPRSLSTTPPPPSKNGGGGGGGILARRTHRKRKREREEKGKRKGRRRKGVRPTDPRARKSRTQRLVLRLPPTKHRRPPPPPPPPPFFPFAPRRSPFWGFVGVCVCAPACQDA